MYQENASRFLRYIGVYVRTHPSLGKGYRPLSIVPVKVAYYATSSARFFFKLCSRIMLVFENYAKTSPKLYIIVNKAWYLLYLELHTCSDKTQLTTDLHSRLEAVA